MIAGETTGDGYPTFNRTNRVTATVTASTKFCPKCEQDLPVESFGKNRVKSGGIQSYCRDCNKKKSSTYYAQNRTAHIQDVLPHKRSHIVQAREFIIRYLTNHPCVDCGESDIVVLDFDHLRDKSKSISVMVGSGYSPESIAKEIEKCEVVCANCHRKRTAKRGGFFKFLFHSSNSKTALSQSAEARRETGMELQQPHGVEVCTTVFETVGDGAIP